MNPLHWSTHAKHVVITGGLCLTAIFCLRAWKDGQVSLAKIESETRVKVAEDQKAAAAAQKVKETAGKAIVVNDAATNAKLADLQRQLNAKPDSAQIRSIVETALPGVKTVQATDAAGKPVLAVEDTQANRDAINAKDVEFKSCKFSLGNCEQNTLLYKQSLDADQVIIGRQNDQIKSDEGEIKKLKTAAKGGNFFARTARVIVPIACAGAGAYLGANKGTKGAAIGALAGGGACALTFHF